MKSDVQPQKAVTPHMSNNTNLDAGFPMLGLECVSMEPFVSFEEVGTKCKKRLLSQNV
jgi:hypothetical protein